MLPDRVVITPDSLTLSTSSTNITTALSINMLSITSTGSIAITLRMAAASSLALHGDSCKGEDSKSQFKAFRMARVEWDDAKRLANFDLFLEHNAEKWWESPAGITCNGTWIDVITGFLMKFSSIPEPVEGCTVLFERLVSCVLTRAELGTVTWDETKKKDIPNHAAWVQRIS